MTQFSTSTLLMIFLAVLTGALNVFSPDRWLPASVLAWQKGWRTPRTVAFSIFALFSHVFMGYLLFLLLQNLEGKLGHRFSIYFGHQRSSLLFLFTLGFIFFVSLARKLRFPRIQEVFRVGPKGVWGSFVVFSLLGPCEVVVPIFVKAKALGIGYLIPFFSFLAGTWVVGTLLVSLGKNVWNRPMGLPRVIDWAYQRSSLFPVATCLALTLVFSLL